MSRRAIIPVALFTIACALPCGAAEPLSLRALQAEARAHAPEMRVLGARLQGAAAKADRAGRFFRHDPSFEAAWSPGAVAGEPDEQDLELGLSVTFELSGSWASRDRAARAEVERATLERESGLLMLDEAVAVAAANLDHAERARARAERIVSLLELAVQAARQKLSVGEGNQLEADAAELDLISGRNLLAITRGDLEHAQIDLARLLGRVEWNELRAGDDDGEERILEPTAVDDDPRIRAAAARRRSREETLESEERLLWPAPTLGVQYAGRRREIPLGSFVGADGLSARWAEREVSFRISLPVPLFDRRADQRARARAAVLEADAEMERVRAEVAAERARVDAALRSAKEAYDANTEAPAILDRDLELLGQALRAGALDAVARAQHVRRLIESGGALDDAVRGTRIARARWRRSHAIAIGRGEAGETPRDDGALGPGADTRRGGVGDPSREGR